MRYERARIARELHDIVAHCVSLIVVQANAGEQLTHQDPESAAEAFESISDAARQAETEIDRLVELLDTSAPTAAPAGLRIVEELVQRARASGLHISAAFSGRQRPAVRAERRGCLPAGAGERDQRDEARTGRADRHRRARP